MTIKAAKGARGKADRLFSRVVRSVGVCAGCGERDYSKLQCCHIISRRYSATRVNLSNAVCGCWTCHRRWTDHPDEWMAFVAAHVGMGEYERLKDMALDRSQEKVDWHHEVERLKALVRDIEAA